jgi:hypothetical protein
VDLLDGGGQAYPRMLLAIARAHRSVHLEVYAFAPSGSSSTVSRFAQAPDPRRFDPLARLAALADAKCSA